MRGGFLRLSVRHGRKNYCKNNSKLRHSQIMADFSWKFAPCHWISRGGQAGRWPARMWGVWTQTSCRCEAAGCLRGMPAGLPVWACGPCGSVIWGCPVLRRWGPSAPGRCMRLSWATSPSWLPWSRYGLRLSAAMQRFSLPYLVVIKDVRFYLISLWTVTRLRMGLYFFSSRRSVVFLRFLVVM